MELVSRMRGKRAEESSGTHVRKYGYLTKVAVFDTTIYFCSVLFAHACSLTLGSKCKPPILMVFVPGCYAMGIPRYAISTPPRCLN